MKVKTYYKETKARKKHSCSNCGKVIQVDDFYYAETPVDPYLQKIGRKKQCKACHKEPIRNL